MQIEYPQSVVNKILQITLDSKTFCYLEINDEGYLINKGGNLESIGLPNWKQNDNIFDQAIFLTGLIPMTGDYEGIPAFQISDDLIIDLHLFKDDHCYWIILVDKTECFEWEAIARQKSNELRLLQDQLSRDQNHPEPGIGDDLFEMLNIMALKKNKNGLLQVLEPVPRVFYQIFSDQLDPTNADEFNHDFAFIDNFLYEAENHWADDNNDKRIHSGPWIETDSSGQEIALEATAINWHGNKLLFIEILDESYQINHELLQLGREGSLLKNILEQEVRRKTKEIREREEEIALRLICAADTRDDGETGSHIRRLGLYSELLASKLGWNEKECEEIRIAAPMHDIGKIGIPDHILKKPAKLTKKEFEIMKTHSVIGGRILSNSSSPLVQMARDISLGHHEKWDGSGYPDGISGEDIPICARIVAIVDVFDALIHKRVYKNEMSIEDAIKIMEKDRGTHFDPNLFDLFIENLDEMSQISHDFINPISGEFDDITMMRGVNVIKP